MKNLWGKVRKRSYRGWKELRQQVLYGKEDLSTVVFILGCQRSGTTLMDDIFDIDPETKVYREVSRLSCFAPIEDGPRRLKPLMLVDHDLRRDRAPIIVLKPLVESQQGDMILRHFPRARVIWMYRNFLDVASSNLAHFGEKNGINNIRPIATDQNGNWRSERLSDPVRALIKCRFSEAMNPFDAAVLFWYARNSIFFDLRLNEHPRVMMLNYETLVSNPPLAMKSVYAFLERRYPGDQLVAGVTSSSLGKGQTVPISQEVRDLGTKMLSRLDECFAGQPYYAQNDHYLSSGLKR